ncbi:UdgX family uracil-DNA binding protein [Terrabacter sp. NPDC080008]|uniref:UdgX family uracil-DNA binding protein n=1 Tax=Terrabacter sp. NPDC080008 TaxID=3155176 RepID=UPI00344FD5DA
MAATGAGRGAPHDGGGAAPWVPSEPTVASLKAAVQACRGCELFEDTTQAVMGDGPEGARLMLLGEQPGDREDREGLPFVGPAGRLLDHALESAGLGDVPAYRTNVVKHFRHERGAGKRIHKSPSRWHVAACEPWLLGELEAVRPVGVVVLGATAGQSLLGPSFRVGASRGRRIDWPTERFALTRQPGWLVATAHPSSVLRSRQRDADLAALVADLEVARDLLR